MRKLFREFTPEKIEQIKTHPYFSGLVDGIIKQAEKLAELREKKSISDTEKQYERII